MKTAILNRLGGVPDDLLNSVPLVGLVPNALGREEYLQRLAFYAELGPEFDPKKILRTPRAAPSHNIVDPRPFGEGECVGIEYPSRYKVLQPAMADALAQHEANQTGKLLVWRHDANAPRKMVLCVHGFMMDHPARAMRMFRIRKHFEMGLDVALYIAPHHGPRLSPGMPKHFLLNPADAPMTLESLLQNLHDLHSAVLLLKKMGWERVGMIGASLGGFSLALYAAATVAPVEFMFLVVPALGFDHHMRPKPSRFAFPVDEEIAQRTREAMNLVSPLSYAPKFDLTRMSTVIHTGDRVCDNRLTRRWVERWGVGNCREVVGGHWLYFDQQARGQAWYGWLEKMGFIG